MGHCQNIDTTLSAPSRDAGFSLLETLFALAIMSLASVALFQSTSSMLRLSDRAVKAGERTVNSALDRLAVTRLLGAIMPSWPNSDEVVFSGDARKLTALSGAPLSVAPSGPQSILLMLSETGNGTQALVYSDAINKTDRQEAWPLIEGLSASARFEYMGVDQSWYRSWPPNSKPTRGHFNDAELLPAKALPEAVRLRDQEVIILSAPLSQTSVLPPRLDLGAGF